jgi:hypothetical protein
VISTVLTGHADDTGHRTQVLHEVHECLWKAIVVVDGRRVDRRIVRFVQFRKSFIACAWWWCLVLRYQVLYKCRVYEKARWFMQETAYGVRVMDRLPRLASRTVDSVVQRKVRARVHLLQYELLVPTVHTGTPTIIIICCNRY